MATKQLNLNNKGFIRFNFDYSFPLGFELKNGRVRFCGICWSYEDAPNALMEARVVWFGPFLIAVAWIAYKTTNEDLIHET